MSWFSHLECSVPCGAPMLASTRPSPSSRLRRLLLPRYDLDAARSWSRHSLKSRPPTMWRYRELMPIFDNEAPVTLGEGFDSALSCASGSAPASTCPGDIKDESLNPTNSFKARGQSAAITAHARWARPPSHCPRQVMPAMPPPRMRPAPGSRPRCSCLETSSLPSSANASFTAPRSPWSMG